jgi:hypothetical protein
MAIVTHYDARIARTRPAARRHSGVEYLVEQVREPKLGDKVTKCSLQDLLNDRAAEGWKLNSVVVPSATEGLLVILERPRTIEHRRGRPQAAGSTASASDPPATTTARPRLRPPMTTGDTATRTGRVRLQLPALLNMKQSPVAPDAT